MNRHINYRMAFAGAAVLGTVVFFINASYGMPLALAAASKQALYTFFVAGFITRNNERLAQRWPNAAVSLGVAVSLSSLLAIGLTLLVHSLKGTPAPWLSTLPTVVMAPPGFMLLAWRARFAPVTS